ncbi:hypothetical protein AB0L97_37205 [Nocardia sp. NPDC051911]|uniref:hypothetical protein n=1 Tax=Nocardia sp. NPDC051911 TaxID=3154648 RepID=UPI00341E3331
MEELDMDSPGRTSFFEVVIALGYAAFAYADVDVSVVEVGMGGRWDATNVADACVSVITPVSLDHTEYLGPDEIAIVGWWNRIRTITVW